MNAVLEDALERIGQLERQIHNVVRHTRIAMLDEDHARVRVVLAEQGEDGEPVLSAWLPWYTRRAGPDIDWHAPEVGEQVTLLSPGGQTELGCVLHSVYQDAFPPPERDRNICTLRFADGSTIRHDRAAHLIEANWVGDVAQRVAGDVLQEVGGDVTQTVEGNVDAEVNGACVLTCPDNMIDGPLHVTENITCDAVIEAQVDVVGAGVSLPHHAHPGDSGGTTGAPG